MRSLHPRAATHCATLIDLVRAERRLQRALQQQQALLQALNDASAVLLNEWRHADRHAPAGVLWHHSLHELLMLGEGGGGGAQAHLPAEREQEVGVGCTDRGSTTVAARARTEGRAAARDGVIAARLLDAAGRPPEDPLLIGSLTATSQRRLVPHLLRWMKVLAEALPTLGRAGATAEAVDDEGGERSPVQHDGTSTAPAALPAGKRARAAEALELPPAPCGLPPLLTAVHPPHQFRLVCQSLRRLLGFLLLLLGLTEAFVAEVVDARAAAAAAASGSREGGRCPCPAADDGMAYFTTQMMAWVGALRARGGGGAGAGEGDAALPLVCLARLHAELRPQLRFLLVDVQEVADVLTEECLYVARPRNASEPAAVRAEPAAAAPAAAGLSSPLADNTVWPSVPEMAAVAHVAQVVGEALRACVHLSGDSGT